MPTINQLTGGKLPDQGDIFALSDFGRIKLEQYHSGLSLDGVYNLVYRGSNRLDRVDTYGGKLQGTLWMDMLEVEGGLIVSVDRDYFSSKIEARGR